MNFFKKSLSFAIALIGFVNCLPAHSLTPLQAYSKWLVKLEVEEVNDKFEYEGSTLRELEKAKVSYFATSQPEDKAIRYEEFWLKQEKTLGLERFKKLDIPEHEDVAICLSFKSNFSNKQQSAAAGSILRLMLELCANGNTVSRVIVPVGTLQGISSSIQNHHFTSSRPQNASSLVLFLQTEDGSSGTTLYYTR